MILNGSGNPKALMRIGLIFLLAASLWRWFVEPNAFLPEGLRDGILGLLFGISITCLLLSVIRRRSGSSRRDA